MLNLIRILSALAAIAFVAFVTAGGLDSANNDRPQVSTPPITLTGG